MNQFFTSNLPARFVENTLNLCGDAGAEWLDELPKIIRELAAEWSFELGKPFPNLSYNFVATCRYPAGEAVLKIALPLNNPEIFNEASFLRLAEGNGAVRLLNFNQKHRAMLLEKLTPGKNLKEIYRGNELQTVGIAVGVARKIQRPPPASPVFRHLADWFQNCFEKSAKTVFPRQLIYKTRAFYEELSSFEPTMLIHGDLHHENILSAAREPFLAIDPKGIIGSAGYEAAVFLNNHLWWLAKEPRLKEKLNEAVVHFAQELRIEPSDLRKWAFAQVVLSAWWTFEENGKNWAQELAFAEIWDI